ncbi:XRE family transcriptional regulator [Corynebacterium sp. sy017]|uniref:helix-turn-helix transcriptional regulator n=1 Tax=unclassified Corynebacterium TaxID=2624378 RepID=UPI001184C398|nr:MULTISPECIES: helix-turn-helix transcriptional regulator [unclassified Corynebacterium]MBP3089093.1 XRE family transcriptional regulator [Corynebacterium sp. sy017]TSD91407.1 XRE family transcriptional regulator [Corynebacterium sp. SY003]
MNPVHGHNEHRKAQTHKGFPLTDLGSFLRTRREKITPEQANLPISGATRRRVPGLRREEVASLAGVSVEYYTQLERGKAGHVSYSVLSGISRALQLSDTERAHFHRLVAIARGDVRYPRHSVGESDSAHLAQESSADLSQHSLRPTLEQIMHAISLPAYIRNSSFDIIGANDLAQKLYAPVFDFAQRDTDYGVPNTARFAFLDPEAARFFVDYEQICSDCTAILHTTAAQFPQNLVLAQFITNLAQVSEDFRRRWETQDVGEHRTGKKRLRHPEYGVIELGYEVFSINADDEHSLVVYSGLG